MPKAHPLTLTLSLSRLLAFHHLFRFTGFNFVHANEAMCSNSLPAEIIIIFSLFLYFLSLCLILALINLALTVSRTFSTMKTLWYFLLFCCSFSGYTGKNCQFESDPCQNGECQNGGTCTGNATHFRFVALFY